MGTKEEECGIEGWLVSRQSTWEEDTCCGWDCIPKKIW